MKPRRDFRWSRWRPDPDGDVREEIAFHLEERARELEEAGLSPGEARRTARAAFGDVERIEARVRRRARRRSLRRRTVGWMRSVAGDVGFALRALRRNPGFAWTALLTLALGIGATTAIAGIADAVFLEAPPVERPERLVRVWTTCRSGDPRCGSSWPDFLDYRNRTSSLADLAAYAWVPVVVGGPEESTLVTGQVVSGNYFDLLGLRPHRGRLLRPVDDGARAPADVAVLRHEAWIRLFGGDPDVVGSTVRLNGAPFTVVGVAPAGFHGIDLGGEPDVWIPVHAGPRLGEVHLVAIPGILERRGDRWLEGLVGRLAEGASLEVARAELATVSDALQELDPEARSGRAVTVDAPRGYTRPPGAAAALARFVWILVAVVAGTLLLACANLANLLLARASARSREMGTRVALGAPRGRLVRQLVTESLLLAGAGGVLGLVVAAALLAALGPFELPGGVGVASLGVALDARTYLLAAAVSVGTGLLFGLAPAIHAARADVAGALGGRGSGAGRSGPRNALVAVQFALCLSLLVGASVFVRTVLETNRADLGFRPGETAVARFNLSLLGYDAGAAGAFLRELESRAAALPGVTAAATGTLTPLEVGSHRGTFVEVEGYTPSPSEEMRVEYVGVGPEYFEAHGIPVTAGRIPEGESLDGPLPAVVNRTLARRYWPGGGAVGGRMQLGGQPLEVVAVVGDVRWRSLEAPHDALVFLPLRGLPSLALGGSVTLAARTSGDPTRLLPAIRREVHGLDPRVAISALTTMGDQVDSALMPQRMAALLLSAFGLLALALAGVGVFGVVAFTVARRRRDIGIRMALGARRHRVLRETLQSVGGPVAAGLVGGTMLGAAGTRALERFLLDAGLPGPGVYVLLAAGLLLVAGMAAWVPARRAAGVDPVTVLQAD